VDPNKIDGIPEDDVQTKLFEIVYLYRDIAKLKGIILLLEDIYSDSNETSEILADAWLDVAISSNLPAKQKIV
jgi:hypothetical protein